jgi:succinoglycan biosynthesis transport protein ExoP
MYTPPYQLDGAQGNEPSNVLSITDMINFLKRRKLPIQYTAGAIVLLCLVWCIAGTKSYVATGNIQIQKEDSDNFGLEGTISGQTNEASDALDYNITLETQVNILQSESLALAVARGLDLENTNDYSGKNHLIRIPAWMKPWDQKSEAASIPLEDAPVRRSRLLREFESRLSVDTVSGTRLIRIRYTGSNPRLDANVVNTLIHDYQDYTFQNRYTTTAQVSTWLGAQLTDLRSQTENLESKSMQMQRGTGQFGANDTQEHNIVISKLEALNAQVSETESNRILKEAVYKEASSEDPELISNLAGTTTTPLQNNALALVQSLQLQQATLESQLQQDITHYGSAYPKIAETKAQLAGVQSSLQLELSRIRERARTDYEVATDQANKANQSFEAQKELALQANDKSIQFELAKREADDSRGLYNDLLKKLKEEGILQGLKSTNISVVDAAGVPARPKMPYAPIDLPIAAGAGLLLGIIVALFLDLTDKRVHNVDDVESITQCPVFAVLPTYRLRAGDMAIDRITLFPNLLGKGDAVLPMAALRPNSPYVESIRALRTSLINPRLSIAPKVIKISSPLSGEGKTTLVMNLGTILARQGSKVLLVDADFRSQSHPIDAMRGVLDQKGLSTALVSTGSDPEFQTVAEIPGLYLLPSGPKPPYPSELLSSERMGQLMAEWRKEFDYVLLDSAPLLLVTDSMVLNQYTDFHLLVARYGSTPKAAFTRSYEAISRQAEPGTVGVVVNAFHQDSQDYEQYYGYKGFPYRTLTRSTDHANAH